MIIHISRERYEAVCDPNLRDLPGFRNSVHLDVKPGAHSPIGLGMSGYTVFHLLDGDEAICETCGSRQRGELANSTTELEAVKLNLWRIEAHRATASVGTIFRFPKCPIAEDGTGRIVVNKHTHRVRIPKEEETENLVTIIIEKIEDKE